MLRRRRLTRNLLHRLLGHVAERDHAHRLPDAEADARHDAAVEAAHAALPVDVLERVADGHLLGPVGVVLLALHLDAHDLDRLVPGRQAAAERGRQDLLRHAELDARVFFAGYFADAGFAGEGVGLVDGWIEWSGWARSGGGEDRRTRRG